MSKRDNLIAKVRAMLAKTIENGCSEAEAVAAMQMAEDMMNKYEITEDDLKLDDEKAVIDILHVVRDPHKIAWKLAYWIAKFTETKSYGRHSRIKYAGLKTDTDFAIWLTETLTRFVQAELKSYMWKNGYQKLDPSRKRIVINGFVAGCTRCINTRFEEMVSKRQTVTNSTALVLAKNALIAEAIKDENIAPARDRGRTAKLFGGSYREGLVAGDKAAFGRPVESGGLLRLK